MTWKEFFFWLAVIIIGGWFLQKAVPVANAQEVPTFTQTWVEADGAIPIPDADLVHYGETAARVEVTWTPTVVNAGGPSQYLIDIPNHFGIWIWGSGVHGNWYTETGERRLFRSRWGLVEVGKPVKIVVTWDTRGYAVIVDDVLRIHDWQTQPNTVYPDPSVVSGQYGNRTDLSGPASGSFTLEFFNDPANYNPCQVDVVGTINESVPSDNTGAWSQGIDPACTSGSGSTLLSWTNPVQNEDGTTLTDLAGIKIWQLVGQTDNPDISSYVISGKKPGDYTYMATAYTTADPPVESKISNQVTKTATGFSVTDTRAYIVAKTNNAFLLLVVGTVPLGTPCDPDTEVNGKNAVPVDQVTFTGVEDILVVAQCG